MAVHEINGMVINTKTETKIKKETIELIKDGEIQEYKLKIELENEESPSVYTLCWEEKQIDMIGFWSSKIGFYHNLRPEWDKRCEDSKAASGIPIASVFSKKNKNRITVALSDPLLPTRILAGVVEENGTLIFQIDLFSKMCSKMKEYEVVIRIDRRDIWFTDAVKSARKWYHTLGFNNARVPQGAKDPLYSAWYSFHQRTIPEEIINECKEAVKYGMKTLIVDDGWQTDDNSRGYGYCGDWEIASSKIPDMQYFVDEIHKLGMKFMVWFSVPFVGIYSKNYEKFKGMYLKRRGNMDAYVLDPRFKVVRDFLTETYTSYVLKYGWDGLKLDFIDSFELTAESSCDYERMDCISVEEGVNKLLKQIYEAVTRINPDFLIEFRQYYIGPVMMQYGNMIRVTDCPNDALMNRKYSVDLRLTCEEVPVHSDMLMWHKEDTNESVMYQLLATMFCVPQISIRFDNITNDHKILLKNYLDFWTSHRETLLSGEIEAWNVENAYSMAKVRKDGESVAVLYQNVVASVEKDEKAYIFNSTGDDCIYVESKKNTSYTSYDMFGNLKESGEIKEGVNKISLENGGRVEII